MTKKEMKQAIQKIQELFDSMPEGIERIFVGNKLANLKEQLLKSK